MPLGALLASAYDAYVVLFGAAVQLAVFLSLLVSADRVLAIAKYLYIKARQRVTGRAPEDYWGHEPLPADEDTYPKVRRPAGSCWRVGACGGWGRGRAAERSLAATQRATCC